MDRIEPALHASDDEQDDDGALHQLTKKDDRTAIEAIRCLPRWQSQQKHGQELSQAYEAELKGAARQIVHLPTNSDGQDLKSTS